MQNKGTILIVDDVKENIDILVELLKDYDLIPALDGKTAIDIAMEENNIDLILLDIMMPNMDGYIVCSLLKKEYKTKQIPIIFLSAKSKQEDIQKGFRVGGVDYVTKPFNPDELLSRVKTHLKLRAYEKDLELRVREEIEKNSLKEHIIFQKTKQAALGEFLIYMSHQWKQPILSLSTLNAQDREKIKSSNTIDTNEWLTSIEKIDELIIFMSQTIDTFKSFYEPSRENKKFLITESIIDILSVIEGVFYFDNIKIYISSYDEQPVDASMSEFSQAIVAILSNSRDIFKARNIQNPKISMVIENKKIVITDNSGYMDDNSLKEIFTPSIATPNHIRADLYLSKVLIEKNGGVINASKTDNGLLFNIEFLTWIE